MTESRPFTSILGTAAWLWGLGGIVALLVTSSVRLASIGWDSFNYDFTLWHWLVLVVHTLFMAHAEGYRGFQRSFTPRAVARAWHLRAHPTWSTAILAPLFCMGYFNASRRRLISAYALTAGIVILIVLFQYLAQPWRGILDVGVVVGLTWGTTSIVVLATRSWISGRATVSPELG